ncbi:MAG: phosphoribosylaminoimidazolesuccinocarboxamide synthase [Acidobacteria bacterium]|nr:phosphoribosylaminoimidazolesuccinocarboxamide synthase [Acidobacteriota bacterium]
MASFTRAPVPSQPLLDTQLDGLSPVRRGKVRDVYAIDDALILVATDRISAFDYVLGSGIPDKGRVLNQLSAFWFARTGHIVRNHMLSIDVAAYPAAAQAYATQLEGRSMLSRRTNPLPVECVARGYLSGSGWKDYKATGEVCGIKLPAGMRESERLPEILFTPATKADSGHDENISEEAAAKVVGADLLARLKQLTLALYAHGVAHAESKGIILADTKFEFGLTDSGELLLIDEMMTPDSSRYWPADQYAPGGPQPSFDKQYVRDYLESIKWNKQPPVPSLPADVVEGTRSKYLDAYRRLTGQELDTGSPSAKATGDRRA